MVKLIRSVGDGIIMICAFFSKNHRSLDVPGQSDQVKKFKRWLSYEPSKHYLGMDKDNPHK